MEKISFVIPCYRSEHTIGKVAGQIEEVMATRPELDYELIMVNDCSPDGVWPVIQELTRQNPKFRGICMAKNFGEHSALMAGYNHVTGDYVVSLDDDGQNPVDQVFILLDRLKEGGFDVVYGTFKERKDSGFRKFGTRMNNWMNEKLLGKPENIHMTSYYIAKRFVIDEMIKYDRAYPYTWGLVLRTTRNIGNALIEHKEREEGESGYTLGKLISLWMNGFTAFSIKPLRLVTFAGIMFAIIGFVMIVWTIVDKIMNPGTVAGYASLMSVLLLIGGMMMLSLGLIGEYIGRIYICINNSPQFVVKEKAGFTE